MKNYIKNLLLTLFLVLHFAAFSQPKLKFGHLNVGQVVSMMNEKDSSEKILLKLAKDFENQLNIMKNDLAKKVQLYNSKKDSLTGLIKQTFESEIQDLQIRTEDFQNKAKNVIQQKEQELLKPIVEKCKKAITEVAIEKGFIYIFDIGNNSSVIYFSTESVDITPMVKAKLKIK